MNNVDDVAGIPLESVENQIKSLLDGVGENDTVTIFNPLSVPFRGKFARTVPQNSPLNEQNKRMAELGAPVTKEGGGLAHSVQYVMIDAGKTIKLFGYAAKVVGRQLVTEIIQRQGQRGQIADAKTRRDVEEQIIINTRAHENAVIETPDESFERELRQLNDPMSEVKTKEQVNEESFPTETRGDDPQEPTESDTAETGLPGDSGTGDSESRDAAPVAKKPAAHSKAKARRSPSRYKS